MSRVAWRPASPAVWVFGGQAVRVWSVCGDVRVWASVLVGPTSVVFLNRCVPRSPDVHAACDWARARIADGLPGFYALVA